MQGLPDSLGSDGLILLNVPLKIQSLLVKLGCITHAWREKIYFTAYE